MFSISPWLLFFFKQVIEMNISCILSSLAIVRESVNKKYIITHHRPCDPSGRFQRSVGCVQLPETDTVYTVFKVSLKIRCCHPLVASEWKPWGDEGWEPRLPNLALFLGLNPVRFFIFKDLFSILKCYAIVGNYIKVTKNFYSKNSPSSHLP